MTARNDVTGDRIITKASTKAYRDNKFWDKRPTEDIEPFNIDEEVRKLYDYLDTATRKDDD